MGKAIWELQQGIAVTMPLSKAISSVAAGVEEIRVKDASGAYRAFYFTGSRRGVLIFYAFKKSTRQTPQKEITLGRKRLMELINEYP